MPFLTVSFSCSSHGGGNDFRVDALMREAYRRALVGRDDMNVNVGSHGGVAYDVISLERRDRLCISVSRCPRSEARV